MKAFLYEVWGSTEGNTGVMEKIVIANDAEEAESKLCEELPDNDDYDYELMDELEQEIIV